MFGEQSNEATLDMDSAVADIGAGLGFDTEDTGGTDDVELVVTPEPTPSPAAEPVPVVADPTATPPQAADPTAEPPKTWRKEASAVWATLPPEAKAEVLKREEDIFKGIESYKVDATFGKTLKGVLAPYEGILKQHNIDPVQQVGSLLQAHYTLATGTPEARAGMFQRLAADYGIDLSQLSGGEAPYIDPTVRALQSELAGVKSQLSAAERGRQAEVAAANSKQVDAFASDTKNVYFNEVADQMATLLQRGIVGTLQEAYDQAVWLNPVTRAKEVARSSAEAAKTAGAEAATKAALTKKATAANVKTSAKSGSATTPLGSIDDTLAAAFASIKARG
jgi:hypothetical protein